MANERQKIYLAALLHDIGKFYKKIFKTDRFQKKVEAKFQALELETDIDSKIIEQAEIYAYGKLNVTNNYETAHLKSIFGGISSETIKYKFPTAELELQFITDFFPKKEQLNADFSNLLEDFEKDFEKLLEQNFYAFAETLLHLLHKFTVTIPVNSNELPDVSLYDHAKTMAAFAVSIYDFHVDNKRLPKEGDKPFRLIGADISGIQKFIYDIVSKNAAKNLKGRSFYLQLMTDSILKYILKELDLFSANVVYSSGGGFFILAPNTDEFEKNLSKIETDISKNLLEAHKTGLFVAISSVKLSHTDLLIDDENTIGKKWSDLIGKLNEKKRQRYADNLIDDYPKFFEPTEQGGDNKENRDSITGEEFEEKEKKEKLRDGSLVTKLTYEQIELGKDLKNADYWIISQTKIELKNKDIKYYNPLNLGFFHYFLSENELKKATFPKNSIVLSINEIDFTSAHSNAKYATGFTFYGGNDYKTYENTGTDDKGDKHYKGEPVSFDYFVKDNGFKRLGILRMDVDNLGQIFMNGLEKQPLFSRYSALSRNLDYYFTGYLNKIQGQEKYKDLSFILYAGGDDLFILGKWDLLISMAKEIKDKFAEWTCNNQNISLSGGISLVTDKFPILKAADLAAEEEKNAKNYKNGNLEKNAFSLWNYSLSWKKDYEFDVVLELKTKILKLLKEEELPKSFVGNISSFSEKRKFQRKKEKNESWQWQMAYQLARFEKDQKGKEVKELIEEVKVDVFTNTYKKQTHHFKYDFIELLNIAARWAELELRTNK